MTYAHTILCAGVSLDGPGDLSLYTFRAIANGVSKDEIREILRHAVIYCGVPRAVEGFANAAGMLKEMGLE